MSGRGGVRSSARLSAEAGGAAPPASAPPGTPGPVPSGSPAPRGRPPAASAAAAERRARAAERAREVEDSPRVLRDKCRQLARALRNAKHLVVYTGAGISTAADIPDYRGPHGVWTRLQRGEPVARVDVARARPTFTHMALTALWARGALKFVASQNCDGLHLRAGLPRRALAELHGDMFCELCAACRAVYLRAFDTTQRTARHQHGTRRLCHACGAELRDSIVHFGERGRAAWPLNWAGALRHAARADVVLCLGSSLKVLRRYPRLWRMQAAPRARPALYIVNLQWTPKDAVAELKINARCDAVMRLVARRLRLRVPRYHPRRDPLLAHAEPLAEPERHTTRRPPLAPAPDSASDSYESCASPSASDSDEELPLRCLADRMRAPPDAQPEPPRDLPSPRPLELPPALPPTPPPRVAEPPPRPPEPPPTPSLERASRAPSPPREPSPSADVVRFRVSMSSGEATILLRPKHVPAAPRASPPRSRTLDLRKFRMSRRPPPAGPATNGHAPPALPPGPRLAPPGERPSPPNGTVDSKLRRLLERRPHMDSFLAARRLPADSPDDVKPKVEPFDDVEPKIEPLDDAKPKIEPLDGDETTIGTKKEPKTEGGSSEAGSSSESESRSLAAAIFRRAVLLCRASLYPGLHTILAPAARASCAWCWRTHGAARCLWYGAPRGTALGARAWRRVRARRYLCACCPAPAPAAPVPTPDAPDDGGWYGKGYRKGRRRRR